MTHTRIIYKDKRDIGKKLEIVLEIWKVIELEKEKKKKGIKNIMELEDKGLKEVSKKK